MIKFRNVIAWLLLIAGIIAGIYFGGYAMFIKPILIACKAFDVGALTAFLIGKTIIKCLLASIVAGVCVLAGFVGFGLVSEYD